MVQDPFLFNFLKDIVVAGFTIVPLPVSFVRQAAGSTT